MTTQDALVFMNLSPGCTKNDITAQYRRLARIYHPDAGGDTERFIQLQEARQVLLTGAKGYARPHTSPQANYNRHQTITEEELRKIQKETAVQEKITTIAIFLAIFLPVIILGFYSTPNILADISAWYVANRADFFGIIFILAFWIAYRNAGLTGIIGAVLLLVVVPATIYFYIYLPLSADLQTVFSNIEMATDAFRALK